MNSTVNGLFLIVSQLSIVKTEFMDNLENEEQGWIGRGPAGAEIWLRHQKECFLVLKITSSFNSTY